LEPVSHYFYSARLKLQFWDWGAEGKPALLLVHGGRDHARSWDWVARSLCERWHVYAFDLRGHGNSAWAPGSAYTIAEYMADLATLADILSPEPVRIVAHSLGGVIALSYAAAFPERVHKVVAIEGLGYPHKHEIHQPLLQQTRRWIHALRRLDARSAPGYATLDEAVARMKEANPRLSDEVARHLTLHGTNRDSDGSLVWKFDNYVRITAPYGTDPEQLGEMWAGIQCPVFMPWGTESFMPLPEGDPRVERIPNCRVKVYENAGHWVHHDRFADFVADTAAFLEG
jgi:pimeloyl-ACP methyl ester carboxylesterase